MNLVIHDLDEREWEKRAPDYAGWREVSDRGDTKPCVGCFGCWLKTPGRCVMRDGYDRMGEWIHEADEVIVISRYAYGGCSSSVKSILDRSIGYILPYFRIVHGEMHHKPRYRETKPFRFIFRGHDLSEEDKEKARKYVKAVCTNFNGQLKELRFEACEDRVEPAETPSDIRWNQQETLLLNGSLRGETANTKRFLDVMAARVEGDVSQLNLSAYLKRMDELVRIVLSAKKVVLGMPLYVDGVPSTPLKLMELVEKECAGKEGFCKDKDIYVVANMGFYESRQIENLLSMVKSWSEACGFRYCGGIAIGAGEMMGQVIRFGDNGPGKYVYEELVRMADAVNASAPVGDICTKANKFPRLAYVVVAHSGFTRSAKKNGLTKRQIVR